MRVTRAKAAENRDALIAAASQLFRERGFDAVSVAEIAKRAGLTHGAFYSHFSSKEALAAAACALAIGEAAAYWTNVLERNSRAPLKAIARGYLAPEHRDMAGPLCAFAALGSDLARAAEPVRSAATDALVGQIAVLEGLMPGKTAQARRMRALAAYSSMVGALVMARAVNDAELSDAFLGAALNAGLAPEPA
jgi:TetR/AcrR family transcriptional repressor of nem operon